MKLEDFLARVVPASGNYLIIAYNKKPGGKPDPRAWSSRTYAATDYVGAAGMIRWCVRMKYDTYHALAAFSLASVGTNGQGQQYTTARRVQDNVQAMRVLVMDADVARAGDGKDPGKVFADRREATRWLLTFTRATGMPQPNLCVSSGYGLHWYWVLEDALAPDDWQRLADALKNAMVAHGWTGDTSVTIDSSRILRPPETVNLKDLANPAPVEVLPKFLASEYPVSSDHPGADPLDHPGAGSERAPGHGHACPYRERVDLGGAAGAYRPRSRPEPAKCQRRGRHQPAGILLRAHRYALRAGENLARQPGRG